MMPIFYILIFLLTTPLIGVAQKDSISNAKKTSFKNQIALEVTYKRRLSKKTCISGSSGFGLLRRISFEVYNES